MGDIRKGWAVHVDGTVGEEEKDTITVFREEAPRIRLEIVLPGIRSAGGEQKPLVRKAIQQVVTDLQAALDSPSALPGFRP